MKRLDFDSNAALVEPQQWLKRLRKNAGAGKGGYRG
jgi:hypothetical protein